MVKEQVKSEFSFRLPDEFNAIRKDIETNFDRYVEGDKSALEFLSSQGITVLSHPAEVDCAALVCGALGLPARYSVFRVIASPKNQISGIRDLRKGDRMVVRYFDERGVAMDNAVYIGGGNFASKWNISTTSIHPLNKVPYSFGNRVEFYRVNGEVISRVQEGIQDGSLLE